MLRDNDSGVRVQAREPLARGPPLKNPLVSMPRMSLVCSSGPLLEFTVTDKDGAADRNKQLMLTRRLADRWFGLKSKSHAFIAPAYGTSPSYAGSYAQSSRNVSLQILHPTPP